MSLMKQCEYCPDFRDSCQSIKRVKDGVLIHMDLQCPVIGKIQRISVGAIQAQSHQLRKGGEIND